MYGFVCPDAVVCICARGCAPAALVEHRAGCGATVNKALVEAVEAIAERIQAAFTHYLLCGHQPSSNDAGAARDVPEGSDEPCCRLCLAASSKHAASVWYRPECSPRPVLTERGCCAVKRGCRPSAALYRVRPCLFWAMAACTRLMHVLYFVVHHMNGFSRPDVGQEGVLRWIEVEKDQRRRHRCACGASRVTARSCVYVIQQGTQWMEDGSTQQRIQPLSASKNLLLGLWGG